MISKIAFIIGTILFIFVLGCIGCAIADAKEDAEYEADKWEREHAKDRDGTGV